MSTVAFYKVFGEKTGAAPGTPVRRKSSRRSMRPFSVTDANELPPTLILEPLTDAFSRKNIELFDRVKIGRQVSSKTLPEPHNGYFNSQVLSRTHAEVWYENGRVYVKDLKSSNGTYLNSKRLSPDSCESSPFELKTGDILEFGIDVESENNDYKKIACKVLILHDPLLNPRTDEGYATNLTAQPSRAQEEIPDTIRKVKSDSKGRRHSIDIVQLAAKQPEAESMPKIVAQLQNDIDTAAETGHELDKVNKMVEELNRQLNEIPLLAAHSSETDIQQLDYYAKRCLFLEKQLAETKDTVQELERLRTNQISSDKENLEIRKRLLNEMDEIRRKTCQLDELVSEKQQVLEEKNSLQEKVGALIAENEKLQHEAESRHSLSEQCDELRRQLEKTATEKNLLIEENNSLRNQVNMATAQNQELDDKFNSVKTQLSSSETLVATLTSDTQTLNESITQLNEQVQKSTHQTELLRTQLAEMEALHESEQEQWTRKEQEYGDKVKSLERRYLEISQQVASYENMKMHLREWSNRREGITQSPLNPKLSHRSSLESIRLSDSPRIISQLTFLRSSASTPSSPSQPHPPPSPTPSASRFHF